MTGVLGGATGASWLEAQPTTSGRGDSCSLQFALPFGSLAALGWRAQRGGSCVLTTPVGELSAEQPNGQNWAAHGLRPVVPPHTKIAAGQLTGFLFLSAWFSTVGMGTFVFFALVFWKPSVCRWGVTFFVSTIFISQLTCLIPLVLQPTLTWSRQLRAPAHVLDYAKRLQPTGYSWRGILFQAGFGISFPSFYLFCVWAVEKWEGWTAFRFPLGEFTHSDQPFLVCATVSAITSWYCAWSSVLASQCFHMWHRAGRDGAKYALLSINDMRFGRFI